MTDRPILFSAPMIRALLDGRKGQTRRLAWGKPFVWAGGDLKPTEWKRTVETRDGVEWETWQRPTLWQKVAAGDRLWCRESWGKGRVGESLFYRATPDAGGMYAPKKWRPSIHMPRRASRLTLIVTEARVEPLQDISHDDVIAEGASNVVDHDNWFPRLWGSIHGAGAWEDNPDVVRIVFQAHKRNIDAEAA